MEDDDKPFLCNFKECGMRFANEDHLTVHKQKHEMSLNLGTVSSSSKFSSFSADQTPTPTRFIKNCDEVGLFQDLQMQNPFEEQFRRASQSGISSGIALLSSDVTDSLNTPCIPPITADIQPASIFKTSRLLQGGYITLGKLKDKSESSLPDESSDTMPFATSIGNDEEEPLNDNVFNEKNRETKADEAQKNVVITPKVKVPTLVNLGENLNKKRGVGQIPVITSVGTCGSKMMVHKVNVSGVPTAVVVKPPPVISNPVELARKQSVQIPVGASLQTSQVATTVSKATIQPIQLKPATTLASQNASVVQLILKLPDGQHLPFNLPVVPSSPGPFVVQSVPAPSTTTANVILPTQQVSTLTKMNVTQGGGTVSGIIPKVASIRQSAVTIKPTATTSTPIAVTVASMSNHSNPIATVQPTLRSGVTHMGRRKHEDSEGPEDEKRRKFLERNRAAATRCRQKRKQWINELERKANEMAKANARLQVRYQSEVAHLRKEVSHLKTLLLAHKDCPMMQRQLTESQDGSTLSTMALNIQALCPSTITGVQLTALNQINDIESNQDYEIIQMKDPREEDSNEGSPMCVILKQAEEAEYSSDNSNDSKSIPGSSG